MTPIALIAPTVKEVIQALQQCDPNMIVILNNRDREFMISEDAAVPPDTKDGQFKSFVFIDPLRIVPASLRPKRG